MERLREVGSTVLGFFVVIAFFIAVYLFFWGGIAFATNFTPILYVIAFYLFIINLIILLPLSFIKVTREFVALLFVLSSYFFALTLWCIGLLLTYVIWGVFAVVIGLFIIGVGVVPIAVLATLVNGMWEPFFALIILTIITYTTRFWGYFIVEG